ncbi:MAG: hypothetical protein KDN22_21585 [Verrucomicrobiae bacterium]|nr:hypothetical protein [Verrucomicrobiae bacterium]
MLRSKDESPAFRISTFDATDLLSTFKDKVCDILGRERGERVLTHVDEEQFFGSFGQLEILFQFLPVPVGERLPFETSFPDFVIKYEERDPNTGKVYRAGTNSVEAFERKHGKLSSDSIVNISK